ncbi:MAG: DUF29 family protein [Synechocystis sp.]|nr:DUF29 family protein [Synechocystis sp.]
MAIAFCSVLGRLKVTGSKVLYHYVSTILEKDYQKARKNAIRKSQLLPDLFPLTCPYTLEQILDPDWLP